MAAYTELHAHSYFSLLDSTSSPESLVERAAALGMDALALTDHDAVYGAVRFVQAAKAHDIQPMLGAEITLHDDTHLTLLVQDASGWANLCTLITLARHNAAKGEARLPPGALEEYHDGLILLSGCRRGAISQTLLKGNRKQALSLAQHYRDIFGRENVWIELQHHLLPDDNRLNAERVALAQAAGIGYVASNNVHYAHSDGHALQDVLVCIRHLTTLDECEHLRPNSEFYLKSGDMLAPLFAAYPDALTNTRHIADRCRFDLQFGLQELPAFPTPDGLDRAAYLRKLCIEQMESLALDETAQTQLDYELRVIETSGLSNYFLIVWDIVRFARQQGILCQGRGSAANSLVAYLLGISPINPLAHDLVFERFLSSERQIVPDIDIDFDAERREDVIQYIYRRYGTVHAAMACTFVTFRARSAIRDVGKAMGLPLDVLEQVTAGVDVYDPQKLRDVLGDLADTTWAQILDLCEQIDGLPRHLGIHNGGMVITGSFLSHRLPTEPATMEDRTVVQWDKDSLEDAGLVKIDILGLRMLSAIAEAEDLIHRQDAKDAKTFDDPAVYDMICKADTVGVFQVESRAQAQVLPRLKPRNFADLVVSISLIRPGPIMGDMVHPYLRRRFGQEPVRYFHPLLQPALEETLGVILFQEQVLKVARDLAGFTPGQGELLRRALGSKRPGEAVQRFHADFIAGAIARGVNPDTAEEVFDRLRAFGGYSFPKSHAAAFAVLVYRSAWLKCYHPQAFYIALLNNQPMGFWSPAVIVHDARRHDIPVLPVSITHSAYRCTPEGSGIRLGFNYVRGFGEAAGERILSARETAPFTHLADFCRRVRLPRRLVEHLIQAGAMEDWNIPRRDLLWELGTLGDMDGGLDLPIAVEPVHLPDLTAAEAVGMEYAMTGLSTGAHPMALYRERLARDGILGSRDLAGVPAGRTVRAAGLVVVHQSPPTAKGFHFVTLEDEDGFINVIVSPQVYGRYRQTIRRNPLLVVEGIIQHEGEVTNLVASIVKAMDREQF